MQAIVERHLSSRMLYNSDQYHFSSSHIELIIDDSVLPPWMESYLSAFPFSSDPSAKDGTPVWMDQSRRGIRSRAARLQPNEKFPGRMKPLYGQLLINLPRQDFEPTIINWILSLQDGEYAENGIQWSKIIHIVYWLISWINANRLIVYFQSVVRQITGNWVE